MNFQQFPQSTDSSFNLDSLLTNQNNRSSLSDRQQLSQGDRTDSDLDPLLGANPDDLFDITAWQQLSLSSSRLLNSDSLLGVSQEDTQTYSLAEPPQLNQASSTATNTDSLLAPGQDNTNLSNLAEASQSIQASTTDPLLGVSQDAALLSTTSIAPPQVASSANYDVGYTFYYVYGNGDFYRGYGYVDASAGYYAGQYIPRNDETYNQGYNSGYYYIDTVTNTGVDSGYQNQVVVNQYFDAETASYAPYLYSGSGAYGYGSGSGGLGSEVGYAYNYSFTNNDPTFGYGYYEADMTTV